MHYPDGTTEEDEETFETEEEAESYGLQCVSEYALGGEILHLHNPGDYPLKEDDDADFDVIEVTS